MHFIIARKTSPPKRTLAHYFYSPNTLPLISKNSASQVVLIAPVFALRPLQPAAPSFWLRYLRRLRFGASVLGCSLSAGLHISH